ncbi:hypothetical protein ACFV3I_15375 [Microbacterium sp. NPDC059771]|uniref:DUF7927 domain-containing protein n=1 Tax=Microbacterium sp. NPDC059771 TaxID=3346941 RepID=UPI0036668836
MLLASLFVTSALVGVSTLGGPAPSAEATQSWGTTTLRQTNQFFAYVNAGEQLTGDISKLVRGVGSQSATLRATSPSGETFECTVAADAVVGTACTFGTQTAAVSGIWTIDFVRPVADSQAAAGTFQWNITVSSGGTPIPGRVWSDDFIMEDTEPATFDLWYVGSTGYQYRSTYSDFRGISSRFQVNQFGNVLPGTCTPYYGSAAMGAPTGSEIPGIEPSDSCGVPYHIFFETPAADLPASASAVDGSHFVLPAPETPDISGFAFARAGNDTRAGTFTFTTSGHVGSVDLWVDADADGFYGTAGDRLIAVAVNGDGVQTVSFDGLDAFGAPIPATTQFAARAGISKAGEIHFVNSDIESRGGISVTAINGPAAGSSTLYWNDTTLELANHRTDCLPPVMDGRAGTASAVPGGVHGWPCDLSIQPNNANNGVDGPWGDVRHIDDWTFTPVDEQEQIIVAPAANYTVVKSSDPADGESVQSGDVVTYTIDVAQVGNVPADATLTDDLANVLDDAAYNGDVTASTGTVDVTGTTLSWNGTLPVGGTATITYSVTVDDMSDLPAGDYSLGNVVTSPGCATADDCSTVHPIGAYSVVKTSDPASGTTVSDDQKLTFTVTVTETGQGSVDGATLTDDLSDVLDDATWNDDLVASAGTVSFDQDSEQLDWSGDLAPGAVVTITYSVTVTGDGDQSLINQVTSPGCASPETCGTTHLYGTYSVVKESDPASGTDVAPGDTITYTVTVTQAGTGAVDAVLTDDLTGVLDDAVWNGDLAADLGTASFDPATNAFTWNGTLQPGEVATITYSVGVSGAGDTDLLNVVTSPGCATADACSTEHFVGAYSVVKTSDPAPGTAVQPGDVITYTVTVTQTGSGAVQDAVLTDELPEVLDDATWNDDAEVSAGDLDYDEDTQELSWAGDLAVGDVVTITYSVTVTAAGDTSLTNTVTSPGCLTPEDCTTNHLAGSYSVVKDSDPAPGTDVATGDTITYTVTVTQSGLAAVTGATLTDDLSEVLDDATWDDTITATSGAATFDPATAQLAWTGDLVPGAVVTITYSVTVVEGGDTTLTNVVTSPGCESESVCTTEHYTGTYAVVKSSDPVSGTTVAAGQVIDYTITVTQDGAGSVAALLSDDLTGVFDDASYNGDVAASLGTVAMDGANLTWNATLAPGEIATITYSVTVGAIGSGDGQLPNVVTSPGCQSETDCATVHQVGAYTFEKTSDPAPGRVDRGDVIDYTLTVRHTGVGPIPGARILDDLTAVLDDATYNDDAVASAGTVTRDGVDLTWTGDLVAGDVVTITYSVTVTGNGDGDIDNVVTTDDPRGGCAANEPCRTEHDVPPMPGLATTGGELPVWSVPIALLLLLVGSGVYVVARRRRSDMNAE